MTARAKYRRPQHSARVTADRLKAHYERWFAKFEPSELNAIERVIAALEEIADGER